MLEQLEKLDAEIILLDTLDKTLEKVLLPRAEPEQAADAAYAAALPIAAQSAEK